MAVKITPTVANTYLVNDVELYQDSENNWLSRGELTTEETTAFLNYIEPITVQKKNNSKQQLFDLERLKKELKGVKLTIAKIKKQREILDTKKDLLSDESLTLRSYYENQRKHYNQMRNKIINNIKVAIKAEKGNEPKASV